MKVSDTLGKYKMISGTERVLCALSGGMDSVVLTHYLATHANELGITVCAAHFSHGIRKDAAQQEKELCISLCTSLGIELVCGEGDSIEYAAANRMGIEQAARELRYAFLRDAAVSLNAKKIATAHHANDNAETVIMNACRGASVKGMCGIPPVRDEFIRPLIDTVRSEIEEYAAEYGLSYALDATNFEPCCRRNGIRLLILPKWRERYPGIDGLLNRFSSVARVYNGVVECKANLLVSACKLDDNEVIITLRDMLGAEECVRSRAFEILCRKAGSDTMLTSRHINALHRLCLSDDPSASADIPSLRVSRRYDSLVFTKPVCKPSAAETIIRIGDRLRFGDWEVTAADGKIPGSILLDKPKLNFPLILRPRREGDRITHNNINKSVKKLMIEYKIPKEMRDNTPLLVDNNRVVAIAGIGFDRRYAPNDDTNIISINFRRIR